MTYMNESGFAIHPVDENVVLSTIENNLHSVEKLPLSEEDNKHLVKLYSNVYFAGACTDWPDFKIIVELTVKLLSRIISCQQCCNMMLQVVTLYEKQVLSPNRNIPGRKRLAYFLSQTLKEVNSVPGFIEYFISNYLEGDSSIDTTTMNGLLLKAITPDVTLIACERYFRPPLLRASLYIARKKEAALEAEWRAQNLRG